MDSAINSPSKPITIVYGPTASGKTSWSLTHAKKIGANILSFDSRQMYTDMDIVTGKDIPDAYTASQEKHPEYNSIPIYTHDNDPKLYGFDITPPDTDWSIAHFYLYAQSIVEEHIHSKTPLILVGGSWQYVEVLFSPPSSLFIPVNQELRATLEKESVESLQNTLQKEDASRWESMNVSDRANPRRLIRAIEVATSSEKTPSQNRSFLSKKLIFFQPEIQALTENIRQRVAERLHSGAIEETQHLIDTYKEWNTPAFSATGYQHIRQYINHLVSEEELIALWTQQERSYAKRQLTWLQALVNKYPQANIQSV